MARIPIALQLYSVRDDCARDLEGTVRAVAEMGHCMRGGGDPVTSLHRYPGRALTVHVKEYDPEDETTLVGEGIVPWDAVFEACETVGGTRWYIVEHERYAEPPLKCVEKCLDNLRRMGKR